MDVTKHVIRDCLDVVVEKRPSIEQLLQSVTEINKEPRLSEMNSVKRNYRRQSTEASLGYDHLLYSTETGSLTNATDGGRQSSSPRTTRELFDKTKNPHIGKIPKQNPQYKSLQVENTRRQLSQKPKTNIPPALIESSKPSEPIYVEKTSVRMTKSLEGTRSSPKMNRPGLKGNVMFRLQQSLDIADEADDKVSDGRQSPSKLRQS